ncbi:hypothetical protein Tco_0412098 [Tanacetum coccineum]
MVKSWLVQDQTVLGKDYSNLLIADSLLKTIWFINAPCYGNEALASPKANELTIPEQTATGKGTSNPFMAGSLPKTTKPTYVTVSYRRVNWDLQIPFDYSKLNKIYESFVPQTEISAEQTYLSIPSTSNVSPESSSKKSDLPRKKMPKESQLLKHFVNLENEIKALGKLINIHHKMDKHKSFFYDNKADIRRIFTLEILYRVDGDDVMRYVMNSGLLWLIIPFGSGWVCLPSNCVIIGADGYAFVCGPALILMLQLVGPLGEVKEELFGDCNSRLRSIPSGFSCELGGVRKSTMWRQFILALGLHTEQEIAEDGFRDYWAGSDRLIPDKGDIKDYWIEIYSDRDFLGAAPSYVRIRDPVRRLCHRIIAYSISDRGQAPEKVTGVYLFYLQGRNSKVRLSGRHFIGHLAMYFGLVSDEGLRGLQVVAPELPLIDLHEIGRLHIYARYGDTWTWVVEGPMRQQDTAAGASEVDEEVAPEILVLAPAPAHAPPAPHPLHIHALCHRG